MCCLRGEAPPVLSRMHLSKSMELVGSTCVVTGVSPNGVGLYTAIGLVKKGATVVIASRDVAKARAAVALIQPHIAIGGGVEFIQLDLGSFAAIRRYAHHGNP